MEEYEAPQTEHWKIFENHPLNPEFPPSPHYKPAFPATSTKRLHIPSHSNVWVKDESENPTGTHKDRPAWEIVVAYTRFQAPLPQMSIISSGSAAIAIQNMLNLYNLPKLKVLCDSHLDPAEIYEMKKIGCELYFTDLSKRELHADDILKLTNNIDGFDITSNVAFRQQSRFYDWLSYEIINSAADYCFVPFGTGILYENILSVLTDIGESTVSDPRLLVDKKEVLGMHMIGATTSNPLSRATKLYSPFLPFQKFDQHALRLLKRFGFAGQKSQIRLFNEKHLSQALDIMHQNGISCEPSGAAGLALFLQMKDQIPENAKILVVNTGCSRAYANSRIQ